MKSPSVSIIVPVYNVEQFLCECVESILAQTLTDIELILINDGSKDNSGNLCNEYAKKDNRVKVIHKRNEGPSCARNIGIKVATGDYIGFVDSDDTINKNMYNKMYNIGKKGDFDIVSCGFVEKNTFTGAKHQYTSPLGGKLSLEGTDIKKNLESLLVNNKILGYASLCNKLFKRCYLIQENLIINENISVAEDLCFNLMALSSATKIAAINECLYIYRRINTESIMNKREGKFYLHLAAREEILKIYKLMDLNENIYSICLRYENCKTVAEYLERIKFLVLSDLSFTNKFKKVNNMIHEKYFLDAINNYNRKNLVFKAKVIVFIIKCKLILERRKVGILNWRDH